MCIRDRYGAERFHGALLGIVEGDIVLHGVRRTLAEDAGKGFDQRRMTAVEQEDAGGTGGAQLLQRLQKRRRKPCLLYTSRCV